MPDHATWWAAADGLRLRQRRWMPSHEPRAVIVFVHGFTEHSLRHNQAVDAIVNHGYAIHAIDLRGHGESEGTRAWIRSFDDYLDDVEQFIAHVRGHCSSRATAWAGRLRRSWPQSVTSR